MLDILKIYIFFIALITSTILQAQVTLEMNVLNGSATSNCDDSGSDPDHFFRVKIMQQDWVTYPEGQDQCFNNFPLQQFQQTYDCPADVPFDIEVCLRTFEDDGIFCFINETCLEEICQYFVIPPTFTDQTFTLEMPDGLQSDGEVTFDMTFTGNFIGTPNDFICDAVDLGVITTNSTIGDPNTSTYNNFCGTNTGEPNPQDEGTGWVNNVATWFTFETGNDISSVITLNGYSDPSNLGDPFDIQIAIYVSDDGTCNGSLTYLTSTYETDSFDEHTILNCILEPNTNYFMMVDGSVATDDGEFGWFGLEIIDHGIMEPTDFICDAYEMGVIPEDGFASTGISHTNACSGSSDDPDIPAFGTQFSNWFVFQAPSSGHVIVEGISDLPQPDGFDPIDIQMGVFMSSNNTCTGTFIELEATYDQTEFDETIELFCLDQGTNYFIVIDGAVADIMGVFGVTVTDAGEYPGTTVIDTMLCFGQSLMVGNTNYTQSGPINETITLSNGCDSIITGNLSIVNEISTVIDTILCPGTSINVAGTIYDMPGQINETLMANAGCDSVITGNLQFYDAIPVTILIDTICFGDTLTIGSFSTTISSPINVIIPSVNGCDSIISGNLTVLDIGAIVQDTSICFGSSILVGNSTYTVDGSYIDTITNATGCLAVLTTNLTVLDELNPNLNLTTPATDDGVADGVATANPIGGSGNYSYSWSNGNTTAMATGLTGGDQYCVTVNDDMGCPSFTCITIESVLPILADVVTDSISCFGDSNGKITITAFNGLAPYSIDWSSIENGLAGADVITMEGETLVIDDLLPGSYTIQISNNDTSLEIMTIIGEPINFDIEIVELINAECFGSSNGSITVSASGGTEPYAYSYDSALSSSPTLTDLSAGDYEVTVQDANGCSATSPFSITHPDPFAVEVVDQTPISCKGGDDGSVTLNSTGNIVSYNWDNGETGPTATQLSAGDHLVEVINDDGCESIFYVNVSEPALDLFVEMSIVEPINCTGDMDGILTAIATGGNPDYSFLWENGSTTTTISNLEEGTYTVSVEDQLGCIVVDSIFIDGPDAIQSTIETIDVSCLGNNQDGQITINTIGGFAPYLYAVNGSGFNEANIYENLEEGSYDVVVEDVFGCQKTYQAIIQPEDTVAIFINDPESILLGDSVKILTQTNSPNVSFTWFPQNDLSCNDCPSPYASPGLPTNYVLTVIDTTSLCVSTTNVFVNVQKGYEVYIPNIFSPNNDGINDVFQFFTTRAATNVNYIRIYDRWGALMYEESNINPMDNFGWDGSYRGKLMNDGVYVYNIEITYKDGETKQYYGDLTILR